ncbi:Mothers against decapentaplegic-like 6, partial [Ophiophagus hannah]
MHWEGGSCSAQVVERGAFWFRSAPEFRGAHISKCEGLGEGVSASPFFTLLHRFVAKDEQSLAPREGVDRVAMKSHNSQGMFPLLFPAPPLVTTTTLCVRPGRERGGNLRGHLNQPSGGIHKGFQSSSLFSDRESNQRTEQEVSCLRKLWWELHPWKLSKEETLGCHRSETMTSPVPSDSVNLLMFSPPLPEPHVPVSESQLGATALEAALRNARPGRHPRRPETSGPRALQEAEGQGAGAAAASRGEPGRRRRRTGLPLGRSPRGEARPPHELKRLCLCKSAGAEAGGVHCCNPHHLSRLALPGGRREMLDLGQGCTHTPTHAVQGTERGRQALLERARESSLCDHHHGKWPFGC